jgi:citryl-CoA lyase
VIDYSNYWTTSVSKVVETDVLIRGYSLENIIGKLPFSASAYLLVRGELPTPGQVQVMDAIFNAILDYALYKPGTVAARYTASANPQMVPALAASILAVGKHTLAPDDTARFVDEEFARFNDSGKDLHTFATDLVAEYKTAKKRIPGLGHPAFKYEDPRAQKLKAIATEAGVWGEKGSFYEAVHRAFTAQPGRETIPINDVGMLALIMGDMGFTPDEMTGVAIISMIPGVIAHISEEIQHGKPIRIVPDTTANYDAVVERALDEDLEVKGWHAQ